MTEQTQTAPALEPRGHASPEGSGKKTDPPFKLARVGHHSLIYGGGMLLGKAVAFIMLPIYTRLLTPADYGVLELVLLTFEVVSIFTGGSLVAGVFRFYSKSEGAGEKNGVITSGLFVIGTTYAAAGCLAAVFAPWISQLTFSTQSDAGLIRIAAGGMIADGLMLVPFAYLRIRERARTFVAVQIGKLLTQLSLNILFLAVFGMGVKGVLLSGLMANWIFGVAMVVYVLREIPPRIDRNTVRNLLRFGLPLVGARVAAFVSTYGDRYFLLAFANTATVGLYSLSYEFGFILGSLSILPFSMVWEPVSFEVAKRADRDAIYARSFIYFNVLVTTIGVGLGLFVDPVLHIMAAPAFYPAARIVPVILAAYLLQGWTNFHQIGLLVKERTSVVTVANWVTMAVSVAGYILLIPPYKGLGAAVATFIAFLVREVIVYSQSQRTWLVRYRWGPAWFTLIPAVIVVGLAASLPVMSFGASVAIRTALLLVFLVSMWMLPVISDEDREIIRSVVKSPRASVMRLLA